MSLYVFDILFLISVLGLEQGINISLKALCTAEKISQRALKKRAGSEDSSGECSRLVTRWRKRKSDRTSYVQVSNTRRLTEWVSPPSHLN